MVQIVLLLLTCTCFSVSAQKIKYDDLFYLLNAKKYDEAEPFLRNFLSNPKAVDHPNANFQLGILLDVKSASKDILTATDEKLILMDSAVLYYEKAKILITEKELKKNDDYYENYYRRDLRTGKMGIKISDVYLDIDNRIGKLKINAGKIKALKERFSKTVSFYNRAMDEYGAIVNKHSDNRQFLLRSDESTINDLQKMLTSYDSAMSNFGKYKILLVGMEFPGYSQSLDVKNVEDIRNDGREKADFLESNVKVWNYYKWGDNVRKAIKNEILPVKSKIVDYDLKLESLYSKVLNDSISVVNELHGFAEELINGHLKQYDPDPFPIAIFDIKKSELYYHSFVLDSLIPSKSQTLLNHLAATEKAIEYLHEFENQVNQHFSKFDLKVEALNYQNFVNERFGNIEGVQKFIEEKKKFIANEKLAKLTELEELREKSNWMIYKNDSIPLFTDSTLVSLNNAGSTYVNFGNAMSGDSIMATYGVVFNTNTPSFYTTIVPPDHIVDKLMMKSITSSGFTFAALSGFATMTTEDKTGEKYILIYNTVYNNQSKEALFFRLNADLNMAWFKEISLHYPPQDLNISGDFGVIAINYNLESVDKSQGLQLISRLLFDSNSGESVKEKN